MIGAKQISGANIVAQLKHLKLKLEDHLQHAWVFHTLPTSI
jgi:hypothetical protein